MGQKIVITVFGLLFLINIMYLNYKVLGQIEDSVSNTDSSYQVIGSQQGFDDFASETKTDVSINSININDMINEATKSLTIRVSNLESESSIQAVPPNISKQASEVKEYYIPLGTGSTNSTNWVDLVGVEANIAPSNYGDIKEMYFEASLRIPSGNGRVYARLINVTDSIGLIESEVSREGTSGGLVSSGKTPVPSQTKLYRVQLKSSLGADVVLDNARIKLFVR